MSIIKKVINNPEKIVFGLQRVGLTDWMKDEQYIKLIYRLALNKKLNLNTPQSFNEKLQWLKLYNRNPVYTVMVDKVLAKEYVGNIIGREHIIPTLGVWEKPDDIDFEALPEQFVLKCNHNSNGLFICKNKSCMDREAVIKQLNKGLQKNYYYVGREWPYKNVKRRILAEKYMVDESEKELRDYKFFCFNGEVKCLKVDFDRFIEHRANYFDKGGNLLFFGEEVCPPDFNRNIDIPSNLNQMIELAEKLSDGIPFVRVDFYNIQGRIYFGELTFFPFSGFGRFVPEEWDLVLGGWIDLSLFQPTLEP